MPNHFLLRVGDGNNFRNSSNVSTWAVKQRNKSFLKQAKEGDKLWFIQKKKGDINNGKIIAVADFVSKHERVTGPLLSITPSNDDLGWDDKGGFCDSDREPNKKKRFYCEDCFCGFNTLQHYNYHLESKKHKNRISTFEFNFVERE